MRSVVLVVAVWLTGCQLIINHNDFAPMADASSDTPDSSLDGPPLPPSTVRSPAPNGVVVAAATVAADATTADLWLIATHLNEGATFRRYQLDFPQVFSATDVPRCVCSTHGGGFLACQISAQTPTSAIVEVWTPADPATAQGFGVVCVGDPVSAVPEIAISPVDTSYTLASLRMTTDGDVVAEDGDWIGVPDESQAGMGLWSLPLTNGISSPRCTCSWTGTAFDVCKLNSLPAPTGIDLATTHLPVEASAADVVCADTTAATDRRVVSPRAGGVTIASASIRQGQLRQDGVWITNVVGTVTRTLTFAPDLFSAPPRCTCASLTDAFLSCIVTTAPSETSVTIDSHQFNGVSTASDVAVICVGE